MKRHVMLQLFVLLITQSHVCASVQVYTTFETWQAATGQFTSIDFVGYDNFTNITNQYEDFGIVFTDGDDFFINGAPFVDGSGINSSALNEPGSIGAEFVAPIHAFAVRYLDTLGVQFWSGGSKLYEITESPSFPFCGFISTQPIEKVVMIDPSDQVASIDNLYFGPPIPAPAALALFGMAVLARSRRRQ